MKKNIYLLLALLTATPSMATENSSAFFSRVLVGIGLSALVSNKAKCDVGKERSLELSSLDEKQVLGLILNNYLSKTRLKTHLPNDLRGLIYRFFIDEWAIQGFNKETGTVYDPHGFDIRGIHKKTKKRLDTRGFGQNGFYKDVNPTTGQPTRYDPRGYDIDRWDKDGLHENGRRVDDNGFPQDVDYAGIALWKAIENLDIKVASLLLKQPGIDVNVQDMDGTTPLMWCCDQGDQCLEIIELLLKHANIDVNLKDKYGFTPLIYCCMKGGISLNISKLLLGHPNIDVNVKDKAGYTPLIWCFEKVDKSLEIAKLLIGHANININLKDNKHGTTPLIYCCEKGDTSLEIAKALLGHANINVNLKNKYGFTPLIWCCGKRNKSLEITKMLLGHKDIKVNLQDNDGYTPLDVIIENILENDGNYLYVNLWNVLVAKGAILNQHKNNYNNLNPNDFKEPDQSYVRLIKKNPPKNCINNPCMKNEEVT